MLIAESKRLMVRELDSKDAEFLFAYSNEETTKIELPDEALLSIDETYKKIDFFKNQYKNGDILVYGVVLKRLNLLIGHISISPVKIGYEIGYSIGENFRGQGYASEIILPFSLWGKEKLGIKEIYGIVKTSNIQSIKTLENSGYRFIEERERNFRGSSFKMRTYVL